MDGWMDGWMDVPFLLPAVHATFSAFVALPLSTDVLKVVLQTQAQMMLAQL